ncbi:nitroreductase/quinone reductase family protein [Mycobacterium sp. smrl_JER01]|uniref:nitroreductase/quinone reductase family protein n=1 Tax=Mycobacterium sp. smrl_JER01 TaxID=3402633 RepID=UPI003ACC483C
MSARYDVPGVGARIFNDLIRRLAELGFSIAGSTAVRVRGRTTGLPRAVVVNVLTVDGRRYLISPRGDTQWARNARAAGEVEIGARGRARTHAVVEVADDAKPELLKRYLDRWYWQVKGHIGGLTPRSSVHRMQEVAPTIPVFEVR